MTLQKNVFKILTAFVLSAAFFGNINAQATFNGVTEYEFVLLEIPADKIYIVCGEEVKAPIEVQKSPQGVWKVSGRDAKLITDALNSGKDLKIIDGKVSKFQLKPDTDALATITDKDAEGRGNKRTLTPKADATGVPAIRNTDAKKRNRRLQTEF